MPPLPEPLAFANGPISASAGIGLKFPHLPEILHSLPKVAWFEIHAENFMSDGGPTLKALEQVRDNYPVSIHGVGLSIGGHDSIDQNHLTRLKRLADWIEPGLVSEHLAWCRTDGVYLNDLLPLRYDRAALARTIDHVDQIQNALGRTILIENPSLYIDFADAEYEEPDFLNEIAARTDCGLLLDINNVVVSASNLKFDPYQYLTSINMAVVKEVHLAGHHVRDLGDRILRIDDHGAPVCEKTWHLYQQALLRSGPVPSLIEWDNNIPTLAALMAEAARADSQLRALDTEAKYHADATDY